MPANLDPCDVGSGRLTGTRHPEYAPFGRAPRRASCQLKRWSLDGPNPDVLEIDLASETGGSNIYRL
jgi:hypothetical protein